jgi:hypothetical protein
VIINTQRVRPRRASTSTITVRVATYYTYLPLLTTKLITTFETCSSRLPACREQSPAVFLSRRDESGVQQRQAAMPSGLCWLLMLGVVLAFGVAASPAQASRANHYDFFVSRSIHLYVACMYSDACSIVSTFENPPPADAVAAGQAVNTPALSDPCAAVQLETASLPLSICGSSRALGNSRLDATLHLGATVPLCIMTTPPCLSPRCIWKAAAIGVTGLLREHSAVGLRPSLEKIQPGTHASSSSSGRHLPSSPSCSSPPPLLHWHLRR